MLGKRSIVAGIVLNCGPAMFLYPEHWLGHPKQCKLLLLKHMFRIKVSPKKPFVLQVTKSLT